MSCSCVMLMGLAVFFAPCGHGASRVDRGLEARARATPQPSRLLLCVKVPYGGFGTCGLKQDWGPPWMAHGARALAALGRSAAAAGGGRLARLLERDDRLGRQVQPLDEHVHLERGVEAPLTARHPAKSPALSSWAPSQIARVDASDDPRRTNTCRPQPLARGRPAAPRTCWRTRCDPASRCGEGRRRPPS